MATHLIVRAGDETFDLQPGLRFRAGRGDDVELTVHDPQVSRHHAVLYDDAAGWWIADEGSANGTFVNGRRISSPVRIDEASVVQLGGADAPVVLHVEAADLLTASAVLAGAGDGGGTVLKGSAPQPFRSDTAPAPLPRGVTAITLGKAEDNDVVVDDINVSRHHARVVPAGDGFLVEDLNSLNGTLLNAVPVQRGFMSDADVLTLGNTDFVRREGRLVRARAAATGTGGLHVAGVEFTIAGGKRLIDGVTLRAERGTLTAIIGPSGAGKSTFAALLAGVTTPTGGSVGFDGFDLQRDYQAIKTRVGLVPQDDVVHRQLLLRKALRYAADLRLPTRLPAAAKDQQVDKSLAQLGLEQHATTRIERLSGGQRKRASVAMELLTEPSLLILDEPTSGLDPALDRQVMRTLRELADGDRTVVVITHSVAYLDICDQVLVLAPGGLPAYLGRSDGIDRHFHTADWADVFAGLASDPAGSRDRWVAAGRSVPAGGPAETATAAAPKRSATRRSGPLRQWATVCARQVNVMLADRGYLAFLAALPVILGFLPFVVPGSAGLTPVPRNQLDHAGEPTMVLALLVMGATFMGVSMSIRDLVGERPIFLRERAVGLSPAAYLLAKLTVFGGVSAVSAAIMVAISTLVKAPPTHHVLVVWPGIVELFVALALTTWVAAALGLLVSAFATSSEQVMPVLILILMVQLVLHGGLISVLDRDVLNGVSRVVPARWGFAAAASGVDLQSLLLPGRPPGAAPLRHDPLWAHTRVQWLRDMGILALFGLVLSLMAGWRLRTVRR